MKSFLEKYKLIIMFIVITFIVLGVDFSVAENNFWYKLAQHIDNSTAIALAVLALFAYIEYAKGEDEIPIIFLVDGKEIDTNFKLLRKSVTRSEILGILGMIQKSSTGRYDIKNDMAYMLMENIAEVQKGKKDKIYINMTKELYDKYFNNEIQ